jgi:putative glutamine amidotransferase
VLIGVADTLKPNLSKYTDWLTTIEPSAKCMVLSHVTQNLEAVDLLDGLLLTGGGDVDPKYYGESDPLSKSRDVVASRDEFEFQVIERALDRNLPILGICRGMQVINVYLGGTLILDLPSAGHDDHSQANMVEVVHKVETLAGSLLREISGEESLGVNSSHHQAVKALGNGLMVGAISSDGVVEAAEWVMKERRSFLLLVQWHPERMDPGKFVGASKALARRFATETKAFKNKSQSQLHTITDR